MNITKVEQLAVESAQLDKPDNGVINPRKSRRTPKLNVEYDDRGYRHSDLILFNGDHEAALLYAQIRYWSGTGRNGKPRASIEIKAKGRGWIAKSAEMLWDELMLTEDQVRRINGVFKAGNAVEVETTMYKRSKCTHYRYVSPHAQGMTLPENPESHSGKKPNHTPGKPHVFTETMAETVSETKNIQNAGAGNTPASTSPETTGKQSGEGKTPKTEQASEPFLKICLSRKLEFIPANDNGQNTPCVLGELTPEDQNTAQRLEYELSKAGIDPLAFMKWLTLPAYQKHMLNLDNDAHWSLFVVMSHREMFAEKYRAYLDNLPPCAKKAATPAPVECPVVVQVDHVTAPAPCADDYDEAPHQMTPEEIKQWMASVTKPVHVHQNKLFNVK